MIVYEVKCNKIVVSKKNKFYSTLSENNQATCSDRQSLHPLTNPALNYNSNSLFWIREKPNRQKDSAVVDLNLAKALHKTSFCRQNTTQLYGKHNCSTVLRLDRPPTVSALKQTSCCQSNNWLRWASKTADCYSSYGMVN